MVVVAVQHLDVDAGPGHAARQLAELAGPRLVEPLHQHLLAGALGTELLARFLALGWLERTEGSRALRVTAAGRRGFRDVLGIEALDSRYG